MANISRLLNFDFLLIVSAGVAVAWCLVGRGVDDDGSYLDSILSWSPYTESWSQVGVIAVARWHHGVTEVSLAAVEDYCHVL